MNAKQLKKLYDLFGGYGKTDWVIKRWVNILGHKVQIDYDVEVTLGRYSNVSVAVNEVHYPTDKVEKKFINDLEKLTGNTVDELYVVDNDMGDVEIKVIKQFQWVFDLNLSQHKVNYINELFYNGGKTLRPWVDIKAAYSQDKMDSKSYVTVRLNQNYEAIITKDCAVQVGCQHIPIDKIREIVKAYDKL